MGTQRKEPPFAGPVSKGPGKVRRSAVSVSQDRLIKAEPLNPQSPLPLMVRPLIEGVDLTVWASANPEFIETELSKRGAILFRDFQVGGVDGFEQFIRTTSGELIEYTYRSTPRTQVRGSIYTSTEYPPDQSIPLHNEMAYSCKWPMKLCFFCVQPAERGGETPLADSRRVFARIDPGIRERFVEKRLMYVRNYGRGIDLPWQVVFQTSDRAAVEDYCRSAHIEFEWAEGDRLWTRQICQSVGRHPKTGDNVWFNQAHLFHVSSLDPQTRENLSAVYAEKEFPRNVYYGDGSRIEDSVLDHIRQVLEQEAIIFPWQANDVLMLDNMLVAHGRTPFSGARKVLAGMAQPFDSLGIN